MLQCYGKCFVLYKLELEQVKKTNNGKLYGCISANNRQGKKAVWKALFTGSAFNIVLNMAIGTFIDITHGSIYKINDKTNNSDSYALIIDKAEQSDNDDPDRGRLFISADEIKILRKYDIDADNSARMIIGSYDCNLSTSLNTGLIEWYSHFVNEAFKPSILLSVDELINIERAEAVQVYNSENNIFNVFLIIFQFTLTKNDAIAALTPIPKEEPVINGRRLYNIQAGGKPAIILPQSAQTAPGTQIEVSEGNYKGGGVLTMINPRRQPMRATAPAVLPETSKAALFPLKEDPTPLKEELTPLSEKKSAQESGHLRLYKITTGGKKTAITPQAAQTIPELVVLESNRAAIDTAKLENNPFKVYQASTNNKTPENKPEPVSVPRLSKTGGAKAKPSAKADRPLNQPLEIENNDKVEQTDFIKTKGSANAKETKTGLKADNTAAKKVVNKYEKMIERLSKQVNAIEKKRKDDAYYILTKHERNLMKRWQNLQLMKRKEDIRLGKKKISKKNTKMKRRRRITSIPRTTQQSIPYIADYEEGLFEVEPNKFSKTYIMQDINYLVAHMDEQRNIFNMYGQFLNYFNDDMNIAITIDNHVVSISEQERNIFYPDKNDDYDIHRHEYNGILRQQIMAGRNDIKITKYVTVTIDCDTPYEAILRFHKIDAEVITNLRRIGSDGKMMTTDERLSVLHDKFRKGHEGEFNINFDFLKEQGLSSKDYIAPASFRFERSHFMIDDEYFRCLYVSNLPNSLVDTFLSELVDVEFPLVTTINIQPLAQDKALRLIKRQLTGMEANKIESEKRAVRSGYSPETISHDLKQSLTQAEQLLNEVQNNDQKMFFVTITLMVNGASPEELDEHCKVLESRARQKTCQLQAFTYQQENAFKCTLPIGVPTYNKIYVERALTTAATAIFIPFSAQELFQIGGFYYGLNQMSRNLILCDRTAMKTPSGFILGSSGSGKSFATKREQLNVLLRDDITSVIVIDPENEYGDFARAFGGVRVNISMESNNYINPMDMCMDYGLDEEDEANIELRKTKALQKKSDVIMSIIQSMISVGKSNETIITPQQKTIVDRAVRRTYTSFLAHNFDQAYLPTMLDLQAELDKERNTKDGELMADGVEYYTKGSMNIFSHRTNVNYSTRFVVFNVKDLGEQLKQIALLIILDFIWNRLMTNFDAGVRTYCYVDEIHVLFQNEYSSRFLQQLYKRGRKYGLVMTGITQNMTDILATEMSRSMIANSDFLMLLNQSPEDLRILADMLNISEAQMSFVNHADAGCGLLFAEKVIVPFIDRFPSKSYLYKLMSTKFGEDYTTETVEDILNEAQQQKSAVNRFSLHNTYTAQKQ